MEIHKKILLILTIIIASIILYRLWMNRIHIEKHSEDHDQKIEGFTSKKLLETNNTNLALNQYFVKASWNTAYTGSYNSKYKSNMIDISMVIDVMNSGCRFLDFEVYSTEKVIGKDTKTSISKKIIIPVVGFSNQKNNNHQMECNGPIVKLLDVFTAISQNKSKVPNGNDPLFIQLRVKYANIELYKSLLSIIDENSAFGKVINRDYSITKTIANGKYIINELFSNLRQKIFIIADLVNSDPMFTNILSGKKIDDTKTDYTQLIKEYQNAFSLITTQQQYTGDLSSLSNQRVLLLPAKPYDIDPNGNIVYITCPDNPSDNRVYNQSYPDFSIFNISNLDKLSVYDLVINHTIHIIPFRFYIDDNNLKDYEDIFTNNGNCAFIKMSSVISTYSGDLFKSIYSNNKIKIMFGEGSNFIE